MPSLFDRLLAGMLPAVPRPIVRRVSRRYIAGEAFDEVVEVARALAARKMGSTMDILGEHSDRPELAQAAADEYLELLDLQAEAGVDRNVSIKLSQLGLLEDPAACLERMRGIVRRATEIDGKVRIDMEDSGCTDATLDVFRALREEFDGVGIVLQAYLHRSEADVAAMAELRPDYRLCKGIYVEPESVAIQGHEEINRNYLRR